MVLAVAICALSAFIPSIYNCKYHLFPQFTFVNMLFPHYVAVIPSFYLRCLQM